MFSNGTQVVDTNALIKWADSNPKLSVDEYCAYLASSGLTDGSCESTSPALCKKKGQCEEDACSTNNDSDRSRANLTVFALLMAGSVFKAFYALVGPEI